MIVVKKITDYGGACPFQVFAETDKGESLYVKYRMGRLRVTVGDEIVFCEFVGKDQNDEEEIERLKQAGMPEDRLQGFAETYKNMRLLSEGEPLCFDGRMTVEQLKEYTKNLVQWPESY